MKSWKLLQALKPQVKMAWLCVGDVNEILKQFEKFRATRKPTRQTESFEYALKICELHDLGYLGDKFT